MINDEIQEITRRFVDALHPEKIILFGSYAKDTERDDSDYDFYIVMDDSKNTPMDICMAGQKAYYELYSVDTQKSVDIIVNTKKNFEHRATLPTIDKDAKNTGVVLYAK